MHFWNQEINYYQMQCQVWGKTLNYSLNIDFLIKIFPLLYGKDKFSQKGLIVIKIVPI
jgi:hypothetical protein